VRSHASIHRTDIERHSERGDDVEGCVGIPKAHPGAKDR
jgi:hypothetical protein